MPRCPDGYAHASPRFDSQTGPITSNESSTFLKVGKSEWLQLQLLRNVEETARIYRNAAASGRKRHFESLDHAVQDWMKERERDALSVKRLLLPRKRLAKVGVERSAVGLAYGPGRRGCQRDEIVGDSFVDAGAGISVAGMAVSVEGQQNGVAKLA
jgi:hypothetical protein